MFSRKRTWLRRLSASIVTDEDDAVVGTHGEEEAELRRAEDGEAPTADAGDSDRRCCPRNATSRAFLRVRHWMPKPSPGASADRVEHLTPLLSLLHRAQRLTATRTP